MGRELPILFNMDMVLGILDNRKTATRRICRDGNNYSVPDMQFYDVKKRTYAVHGYADSEHGESVSLVERTCPFCPDDILYVRETWAFQSCIECMNQLEDESCMLGKMSTIHEDRDAESEGCYIYRAGHLHQERVVWRPSIHMPKAATRIWLHVTGVTVERLQDMTLDDFLSEGVVLRPEAFNDPENAYWQARDIFRRLWDSTLTKAKLPEHGWEANPWVWAIEFERREKPEPCILKGLEPAEDKRPCIGYAKNNIDDEPCEMCKGCNQCTGNDEFEQCDKPAAGLQNKEE